MEQTTIFDNDQPCVRCPTCFCRLYPCTQANEIRCCAACSSFGHCSTKMCEWLTKDVK